MINGKKINNEKNSNVKIFATIVIFICIFLTLWITYSFYGFYQSFKKTPENIGTDSYIDKQGMAQVKSMLEQRK